MGTVIDELVVQLKLDPKQFDDAQKATVGKLRQFERDHERHSKKLSKDTDGLTQSFAALQGRLLGIASLFMGGMGIQQFTEHITRMTVQTGYLAASLGLSTSELAKWQGVGATVNATSGEMAQTIKSVQEAFADMRMGRPSKLLTFSRITHNGAFAGAPVDVDPFNPDPTKFMTDVSRWYVAQKDRAVATKIIQDNLGFNQGTMNALALGPEELQKRLKEMEKYGPTKEEVKNFQDLQEALSKAATKAEALGRAILSFLTPGIVKFLGTLSGIADTFRDKGASEGAKAIDDAASGGVGEAFGTVKGWGRSLWNRGKRALGFGGADDGGNVTTEPGQAGVGTPGTDATSLKGVPSTVVGPGSSGAPSRVGRTGWWTPDRKQHAVDYLMKNANLPEISARAMVARWAGVESTQRGASEINYKGAIGIAQWLGNRKRGVVVGDFDSQLAHVVRELRGPENRSYRTLMGARDATAAAIGASMYERAEGYNPRTGEDNFTGKTIRSMKLIPGGSKIDAPKVSPTSTQPSAYHPGDILLNGGGTPPPFSFGAGAAMQRGAPVTNNNRTSSTNIQSMNVTVPQGSDPDAYARGISQRLAHYNNVQGANQGLV